MINLHHLPHCTADEKTIHFLRRHWITLVGLVLGYVALLVAPFAVHWYLKTFQPQLLDHPVWTPLIVLWGSFFFLYAWLFLFQNFMDYYLDIWIVTNKRILNIEQIGLFSRRISELRLYNIQDVTSDVTGMLPTLLDYGHVEIQTAGEKLRFQFEEIPHPSRVAKSIQELSEADRKAVEGQKEKKE